MNYPESKIDIILLSCNRIDNTRETIDRLYNSIRFPDKIRLIVVDNESIDGTYEYLLEEKDRGRVHVLESCPSDKPITMAYNIGFKHVESDLFIMQQDDIDIPDLEPKDVIEQLIELIEKTPDAGSVGCRIQRIPNMDWSGGTDDLAPARKSASAYFRIQYKNDYIKMGMLNERKDWDDVNFCYLIRSIGKECYWTKKIWASHDRGYCLDRGYIVKPRRWGTGIHSRTRQAHIEKPYPLIDPKTCVPLTILNADKKVKRPLNQERDFFGYKMSKKKRYYDEKILMMELDPERNIYELPEKIDVMVDVGAHIGGTALRAAKKSGATVYAFEPELYNFETLCHNVRRNRLHENIHCINMGVGKPGRTKLYIHDSASGTTSSFMKQSGLTEDNYQIAIFHSLKYVFDKCGIDHCTVLKMDCEGSEEDIIREFDDILAEKIDQISLEFHDKHKVKELVDILSKWYVPKNIHRYEWVFTKKYDKDQE